jgi:hypothetical protein
MKFNIDKDFFDILRTLEEHHSVFYAMWNIGRPIITEEIDTAAIRFGNDGNALEFLLNEKWWTKQTDYNKRFAICHECLHIILRHGQRADNKISTADNVAMDLAVNHMLVNNFNFDRSLLKDADDFCWIDTIFKKDDSDEIKDDGSYEYYLYKIKSGIDHELKSSLDDHEFLLDGLDEEIKEEVFKAVADKLPDESKKGLQEIVESQGDKSLGGPAGTGTGSWLSVNVEKVKKKKQWENVIKDWSRAYLKYTEGTYYQWAHINRRFVNVGGDFILPSESTFDVAEPDKINVWFFLDTSGSCINLKDRFFKAALSLPEEKFKVDLFSFDTRVKDVDKKKKKVYGGGGTSFRIIESHIQRRISASKEEYPHAIFIITDGWGDRVSPEHPSRWYWFLTNGASRSYIPNGSHSFNLANYS